MKPILTKYLSPKSLLLLSKEAITIGWSILHVSSSLLLADGSLLAFKLPVDGSFQPRKRRLFKTITIAQEEAAPAILATSMKMRPKWSLKPTDVSFSFYSSSLLPFSSIDSYLRRTSQFALYLITPMTLAYSHAFARLTNLNRLLKLPIFEIDKNVLYMISVSCTLYMAHADTKINSINHYYVLNFTSAN